MAKEQLKQELRNGVQALDQGLVEAKRHILKELEVSGLMVSEAEMWMNESLVLTEESDEAEAVAEMLDAMREEMGIENLSYIDLGDDWRSYVED